MTKTALNVDHRSVSVVNLGVFRYQRQRLASCSPDHHPTAPEHQFSSLRDSLVACGSRQAPLHTNYLLEAMFSALRIPGRSRWSSTKRTDMIAETVLDDG